MTEEEEQLPTDLCHKEVRLQGMNFHILVASDDITDSLQDLEHMTIRLLKKARENDG